MPKTQLENTREHDITLHLVSKDQVSSVTIPAAVQNPDDRSKTIHGVAEVDADLVASARKNHPAVKHYFHAGWLRDVKSSASETEK